MLGETPLRTAAGIHFRHFWEEVHYLDFLILVRKLQGTAAFQELDSDFRAQLETVAAGSIAGAAWDPHRIQKLWEEFILYLLFDSGCPLEALLEAANMQSNHGHYSLYRLPLHPKFFAYWDRADGATQMAFCTQLWQLAENNPLSATDFAYNLLYNPHSALVLRVMRAACHTPVQDWFFARLYAIEGTSKDISAFQKMRLEAIPGFTARWNGFIAQQEARGELAAYAVPSRTSVCRFL